MTRLSLTWPSHSSSSLCRPIPVGASVETLERRVLLDGSVIVSVDHGNLRIRGDRGDNQVLITQPSAGVLRIAGLDDTEVNGEESVDLEGLTGVLQVQMDQGGEDEVAIQGPVDLPGGVSAKIKDGQFIVEGTKGPVTIGEDLIVKVTRGDILLRNEVIVQGDARLTAGAMVAGAATAGIVPDFPSASFSDSLTIDNPYLPWVPGTIYVYEEQTVDDETGDVEVQSITVEVTNQTRTILGVPVRVVHDQVFSGALLLEDTFDFYGQDDAGNVWYFGEDTTAFQYDADGNLIGQSKEGSFEAGGDGALPGIVMEASPQVGDAYYQEVFAGHALDQGMVLATDESATVSGVGTFSNVLRTRDTTVLEPGVVEEKLYAPGLGLIDEENFDIQTGESNGVTRLISVELNGVPVTEVVPPVPTGGANAAGEAGEPLTVLGDLWIRANGPAILNFTEISGQADILSKQDGVTLVDSVFAGELAIRAQDAVAVRDVQADDRVKVDGDLDLFIVDSDFLDDVDVHLGKSDNELLVEGSSFVSLIADGSKGDDTFDDAGDNVFGQLKLRRFEA